MPRSPLQTKILELLKQGDKNQSDLLDATGVTRPELNSAIVALKDDRLVESYFDPCLTYRLVEQPILLPAFPWFQ